MHCKGFLHRDIKPSNFAFDDKQSIHILDFGLSRKVKKLQLIDKEAETEWHRQNLRLIDKEAETEAETEAERQRQRQGGRNRDRDAETYRARFRQRDG